MKVAGESENYDTEQEHLNGVFGARLRITALRADEGPGIELLEYLAPRDGRAGAARPARERHRALADDADRERARTHQRSAPPTDLYARVAERRGAAEGVARDSRGDCRPRPRWPRHSARGTLIETARRGRNPSSINTVFRRTAE